jgi:hypothetical protein
MSENRKIVVAAVTLVLAVALFAVAMVALRMLAG